MTADGDALAGVVLAAGFGTRLAPLTTLLPKALCPVANRPLLDHALDRLAGLGLAGGTTVAVNAHAHAARMVAAVGNRATVSVEAPQPLGSAGALGALRGWLDGRAAVVANVDAYLDGPVDALLSGWDGERVRLLVVDDPARGDFGRWRFAGCSLLPWREIAPLRPVFSGLYETCWQPAIDAARAELVPFTGTFVDCGTPADYLRANLHASGGESVIGEGAVIRGEIERCVVWPGAEVRAGERLIESIRAAGLTVDARQARQPGGPAAPGSI